MEYEPQQGGVPDNNEKNIISSTLPFPVVGLGASAGGITALQSFFEHMPDTSGMAFVVLMHLAAKHQSNLAEVLQKVTKMPVTQVMKPLHMEPNHVYVIPPSKQPSMNDGYLRLADIEPSRGRHVVIDIFFRTLADVHKERAIAIVLSGMGADGAVGLPRIKEQGGITIAQTLDDAEYESMPASAIETGMVDFVLPVSEMPEKLLKIWSNARNIRIPQPEGATTFTQPPTSHEARAAEEAVGDIMTLLRTRTGHDFSHYKRATLLRRLERRLQVCALTTIPQYRDFLHDHAEETAALLDDFLIGVTNFFRDREAFEALEREVVPLLFSEKTGDEQVRIWVPACATGEEAYSLAMLMAEYMESTGARANVQIFATDIDERALSFARCGKYPESIVTDVPPARLRRFFTKQDRYYQIKKEIRERVLFASHNILRDPPFSKLDLISCRNLLIYLDRDVHGQILKMFHFVLRSSGFLFLGGSETVDSDPRLFLPLDKKNRIYRAADAPSDRRFMPKLPLSAITVVSGPKLTTHVKKSEGSLTELHQQMLEQYAPPSVLVNREFEILHLSDRVGRFLNFAGGEPSHQLLAVVRPELRLELRMALFEAMQSRKSVEARRVQITREARTFYVNMVVRPVKEKADEDGLLLVLFDEVEDTLSSNAQINGDGRDPMIVQLETELKVLGDRLQNTIEQYETSTEELKVSNEELQAMNEELRSASEELETSKEELHSINEELTTVNHELKLKVEEAAQVNNDLQNLIASTDIATIFVDRNMLIKRFTPQASKLFNIIEADIGRSLLDITHRLQYDRLAKDATETFESLQSTEQEIASIDGRWYLARFLPYRTTEDHIDGAVLTFIDITSRRQAEIRARAVEELTRLVVESATDYAILTLDSNGYITSWNKGAERIFGWTASEAIGQNGSILFLPEDHATAPQDEMTTAKLKGRAEDERWQMRKDGTRFYCSGVMTLLKNGEVPGYAKIARDLTGQKYNELERESLLSQEKVVSAEAQAANEIKDEFMAVLSHELKNPLNLIQINAELLTRLPEAKTVASVQHCAEVIKRAIMSQSQIIDDLLDLTRVRTGKLLLNCAPIQLNLTLDNIVGVFRKEAAAKKIELVYEAPAEPVAAFADSVRVEQIIWNLLGNAVKFTPQGGRISVCLSKEDGGARLEIADTGTGIDPDLLPHIFDMFRQADSRITRQHGGLGIGLALVRHLTELHGGRVSATSAGPGRGATFTV